MNTNDSQPRADVLTGQTILVTGAGDGLGRAVALACAAHGATVVLVGRVLRKLEDTYDAITAGNGAEPALLPLDLATATEADFERAAAVVREQIGRLDGLVLCAAQLGMLSPVRHFDAGVWERTVQLNLTAEFLLVRACLPLLLERDTATIVFTEDEPARTHRAYWGAYAAANAGRIALREVLTDEMNDTPVRVAAVVPPPMRTRLRLQAFPAEPADATTDPAMIAPAFIQLLEPATASHGLRLAPSAG
ncbi:MAG: SDR family NAD(P)-dependent oxidoreductase [Chromatiales bacterium]|nr:SDR family NAD(P)-dependent oxidoreductase [Chromatiales bacterium]